jgi:Reverse transcriptase (RNA-dependent DNA polymerase)
MILLHHFHSNTLEVVKLNHAMVLLIPKEKEARKIQKYRLISLVDRCYKIISKIVTNRLAPLMNNLVDPTQTAFIKERYILDNVLAASEIIHSTKRDKTHGVFLKIDFKKAYDRINWDFIQEILMSMGFALV